MTNATPSRHGPVIVIDDKPLRRSMIAGCLDRLGYGGACAVASAEEALSAASLSIEPPTLIIVSIGANRLDEDGPTRVLLQSAERAYPTIPLVLISDIDTRAQVLAALALGVKGFIHTEVSENVMALSLQIVQSGGSIAPTRPFVEMADESDPLKEDAAPAKKKRGKRPMDASESDAFDPEEVAAFDNDLDDDGLPQFSPRQLEVLRLIRSGAQNKHIAHRLQMREGTVKVHVRNIFRKLSVTNRTQAVFVAAQRLLPPPGAL
jgi:DNA-binding NarL/FixJ family response regulator